MLKKTITVFGSLNFDLVTTTGRLPNPGETLTSNSFNTFPGGKGANQAVAARRFSSLSRNEISASGIEVKMVGAVGDDMFGVELKETLEKDGVECSGVAVKTGMKTGVAVIIIDETSQNRILVHPGANGTLLPQNFPENMFSISNSPPVLIILQLETPLQTVLHLIKLASDSTIPVLFNPAPAIPIPMEYYPMISYLILNETETQILTGYKPEALDPDGVRDAAHLLLRRGVRIAVVITMGAEGGYWATWTGGEGWVDVKASPEQVVDTTGAGDTFVGAFGVAIVEGKSVKEAVEVASRASGISVTRMGAMGGIPWRAEVANS